MSDRAKRQFKHTPGPWKQSKGQYGNTIEAKSGRDPLFARDDGYMTVASFQPACPSMLHADKEENRAANGRLIIAAPSLATLLADIETDILPLLPDIDPVIEMRRKIASMLDYIEKGDISATPPT